MSNTPITEEMVEAGAKAAWEVREKQSGGTLTWEGVLRRRKECVFTYMNACDVRDQVRAALTAALQSAADTPAPQEHQDRPLCAPIQPSKTDPAWVQVIKLFQRNGMGEPPVRLRDEIVNALAWAWYAQTLENQHSLPTPVGYRWRGIGEWFYAPHAPEGVDAQPLYLLPPIDQAAIDRIIPPLDPVSEDYIGEWALWKDRDRIRRELSALISPFKAKEE